MGNYRSTNSELKISVPAFERKCQRKDMPFIQLWMVIKVTKEELYTKLTKVKPKRNLGLLQEVIVPTATVWTCRMSDGRLLVTLLFLWTEITRYERPL